MYSTASVACKNWHPDTTGGTYLPQNTREASYAIFPIPEFVIPNLLQFSLQIDFSDIFTIILLDYKFILLLLHTCFSNPVSKRVVKACLSASVLGDSPYFNMYNNNIKGRSL